MFGKVGEKFPMKREKQDCFIWEYKEMSRIVREFEYDCGTVTVA